MVCGIVIVIMLLMLVVGMKFLGVAWDDPTFKIAGQYSVQSGGVPLLLGSSFQTAKYQLVCFWDLI